MPHDKGGQEGEPVRDRALLASWSSLDCVLCTMRGHGGTRQSQHSLISVVSETVLALKYAVHCGRWAGWKVCWAEAVLAAEVGTGVA